MAKRSWKVRGNSIHVHSYIPIELYEMIKEIAIGGNPLMADTKWESAVIRKALAEFAETHRPRRKRALVTASREEGDR